MNTFEVLLCILVLHGADHLGMNHPVAPHRIDAKKRFYERERWLCNRRY